MKRREFINKSLGLSTALSLPFVQNTAFSADSLLGNKILNAYYFRAHMYTLVPRHVREDLRWMADNGTNVVSLAILEQDLHAARENIEFICEEADKLKIKVFAVPSRWGGLLAGAPKVPSHYSVTNPNSWALNEDGTPQISPFSGVISSILYPEIVDFFIGTADKVLSTWRLAGLIWDEPKNLGAQDYSERGKNIEGYNTNEQVRLDKYAEFFSVINDSIKKKYPEKIISLFIYANYKDQVVDTISKIRGLDYFGCDGRPWDEAQGGNLEDKGKTLGDNGQRFIAAAKKANKKSMLLIENHNLIKEDINLMDKGMEKILAFNTDQLVYYYYPRNIQDPDRNMAVIAKHVKKFNRK